jgi:hypothetical protein
MRGNKTTTSPNEFDAVKKRWANEMDEWIEKLNAIPRMNDAELSKVVRDAQTWGGSTLCSFQSPHPR